MLIGCIVSSMVLVALGAPNGCSDDENCADASKFYVGFPETDGDYRCLQHCMQSGSGIASQNAQASAD
ncbi:hypothetical protein NL676_000255 [Syzygium grande]|nr:hypothetical protein NL676_000255 [Syzygium grande]